MHKQSKTLAEDGRLVLILAAAEDSAEWGKSWQVYTVYIMQ